MPHSEPLKAPVLSRFLLPNQKHLTTRAGVAVRMALIYVAVNLLGLWVAKQWFYDRPLINIDYGLVVLVYLWVSRTLASALLVLLFFVECARYLIPTYFFSKQALSIFFWLRATSNWSPAVLLGMLVMVFGLILAVTLLFRRYRLPLRLRIEATVWVFAATALLMLLDSLNGTNSIYNLRRGGNLIDCNFSGSPLNVVLRRSWDTFRGVPAEFAPLPLEAAATGRYFLDVLSVSNAPAELSNGVESLLSPVNRDRLPDKLVVVVFESLSVSSDDTGLKNWRQPFEPLQDRYTIKSGALDWFGATFRGEVRELCWQSIDGNVVLSLPPSLPATLQKLGYETDSFHGFYKTTYDRDRLYPLLGFENSTFLDEMRRKGNVPLAGTLFHGAEDTFVAEQVHRDVLRPGKRLVYWLTLSSHVPINIPFARRIATPGELAAAGDLPSAVWAYRVICHHTLESIAAIAADPSLNNCDFVIVGDHPLPVSSGQMRGYFVPGEIAYLILRHKNSAARGG